MSDIKNEETMAEPIEVDETPVEDAEVVEEIFETKDSVEQPEKSSIEPMTKPRVTAIWPLIAGGAVAGAIGFGAATNLSIGSASQSDALAAELNTLSSSQSEKIELLSSEISRIESLADNSSVLTRLQDVETQMQSGFEGSAGELTKAMNKVALSFDALEQRLLDLEKRPMAEAISAGVIEAYETEMSALRNAIAAHRSDIEKMAADARAMEVAAREDAVRSEGTSWLTDINVALVNGAPFDLPIAKLEAEGITIPTGLSLSANDGVSTQIELVDLFPSAAREALGAIRSDIAGEQGGNGLLTFLQNQLGARSVAPKDGDSADAILSRAEAATRDGDLINALSEIETLAPAGLPSMAEWIGLANERLAAISALDELREMVINK